jgi:hypothetical protein
VILPSPTRRPEWRKDVVVDERDEPEEIEKRKAEGDLQSTWKRRSLPIERGERGVQQPNIARINLAPSTAADLTADLTADPTADLTADPTADLTADPTADPIADPTTDLTPCCLR